MYTTTLRKVGDAIMMSVPPAFLEILQLSAGAKVTISLDRNRLVVETEARPSYGLDELLGQCDWNAEPGVEDSQWLEIKQIGNELL